MVLEAFSLQGKSALVIGAAGGREDRPYGVVA